MKNSDFNRMKNVVFSLFLMVVLIGVASAIGHLFRNMGFPETNTVIIYILSVLLTARLTYGYTYGILASLAATFAFNYFFTHPILTFSVEDPSYLITFTIMTITAIITSALTSRIKKNAAESEAKEMETSVLYQLTSRLTEAIGIQEIANLATESISEIIGCEVDCVCFNDDGKPEQSIVQQAPFRQQIHRRLEEGEPEFKDFPICSQDTVLGIIKIPNEKVATLTESQTNLLNIMIESIALAMDRFRQAQQRMKSNEEMVQERYRGNLLRAISHDLRTPLSGIMGTSEILMDMTEKEDLRYEMAMGIYKDADWLRSLVVNILNLTRLQENKLFLHKEKEAVEEIVGSAVAHITKRSPEYEITVEVPEELLMIPMDAKLIEQVLINLLDNAIKHSKQQDEIFVKVEENKEKEQVKFFVIDSGEGILESDLPNIFQMFYTSNARSTDVKHGIGLGLTICDAIVRAHGGRIEAGNRTDGNGASFSFTLPCKEETDEQL